jgi:8-oxo-dGTP diphosphatase
VVALTVRAAGGVLARDGLVALVHRPRYDDWTLPKGKLTKDEHPLVGACREVWEETGVRPAVRTRLPSVTYPVRTPDGWAEKTVDYWAMAAVEDTGFTPDHEVDEVAWATETDALARLTYPHDVEVLGAYVGLPVVTAVVTLVRHAHAGRREAFPGEDSARPLSETGRAQATALGALLGCLAPVALVSGTPRRCVQTLVPLASTLDLPIEVESVFDEDADPAASAARLAGLAAATPSTVVCSQGGLIPPLVASVAGGAAGADGTGRFHTPKGAGWVLSYHDSAVVAADALHPLTGRD